MIEDPETYAMNAQYRSLKYQNITSQQFQMVYYGKFTWTDTDNMSITERNVAYNLLYEQKKAEKENYEKQMREAKSQKSSRPVRHR